MQKIKVGIDLTFIKKGEEEIIFPLTVTKFEDEEKQIGVFTMRALKENLEKLGGKYDESLELIENLEIAKEKGVITKFNFRTHLNYLSSLKGTFGKEGDIYITKEILHKFL